MGVRPAITPTNPGQYNHGYNGSGLQCVLVRGAVEPGSPAPINIMARATGVNYNVPTPISQADEINTTYIKETNYGRQDMVRGRMDSVFTLAVKDQIPTFDTIRNEPEMTLFVLTGDDHEQTDPSAGPTVLAVFTGLRIVNSNSAIVVNQQKILGVEFEARQHFTGATWLRKNPGSFNYPATVV